MSANVCIDYEKGGGGGNGRKSSRGCDNGDGDGHGHGDGESIHSGEEMEIIKVLFHMYHYMSRTKNRKPAIPEG